MEQAASPGGELPGGRREEPSDIPLRVGREGEGEAKADSLLARNRSEHLARLDTVAIPPWIPGRTAARGLLPPAASRPARKAAACPVAGKNGPAGEVGPKAIQRNWRIRRAVGS
jgi:hypothetical protein